MCISCQSCFKLESQKLIATIEIGQVVKVHRKMHTLILHASIHGNAYTDLLLFNRHIECNKGFSFTPVWKGCFYKTTGNDLFPRKTDFFYPE